MSFGFVLLRSVILTVVVVLFLLLIGRSREKSSLLVGTFLAVALTIHVVWWRLPDLHGQWGEAGRWLVTVWIGAVLTAVILIVPLTLLMTMQRLRGRGSATDLRMPLGFVALSLAGGIAASFGSMGAPLVREETVQVRDLPEALDGLRIANIGDVHIGRFIVPADLARAIDIVNRRQVDLLAVTGDLIDDLSQLDATLDVLEASRALPLLSILGNHDKISSEAAFVSSLQSRNPRIRLLVNDSVVVHPRGTPLRVVGVDYPLAADGRHMLPRAQQDTAMRAFAERAFARTAPGETMIALSHHPEFFRFAAAHGAVLTLSGHTHGGQVRLFGRPLIVAYDYMHGLYRQGAAYLDVTSGLGHWLPLRIGVPPELSIITLKRG